MRLLRLFILIVLTTITLQANAVNYEFGVVSESKSGDIFLYSLTYNGSQVKVELTTMSGGIQKTTLVNSRPAEIGVNNDGIIVFTNSSGKAICGVYSNQSGTKCDIYYNNGNGKFLKVSKTRSQADKNFASESNKLKSQLSRGKSSKRQDSNTKKKQSKTEAKYANDPELLKFLRKPLGKFDLDMSKVSATEIKKALEDAGIKYELCYYSEPFFYIDHEFMLCGEKFTHADIFFHYDETKLMYTRKFDTANEAKMFCKKLIGTLNASGINIKSQPSYGKYEDAYYDSERPNNIRIRHLLNDNEVNIFNKTRYKKPKRSFQKFTLNEAVDNRMLFQRGAVSIADMPCKLAEFAMADQRIKIEYHPKHQNSHKISKIYDVTYKGNDNSEILIYASETAAKYPLFPYREMVEFPNTTTSKCNYWLKLSIPANKTKVRNYYKKAFDEIIESESRTRKLQKCDAKKELIDLDFFYMPNQIKKTYKCISGSVCRYYILAKNEIDILEVLINQ